MTGWNFLLPGITFGLAAAAQPGPLMIYLVSRTLESGWKRTLPAVFAPLISDGPIALVCLLLLGSLSPAFLQYIRMAGGVFILYLSVRAGLSWRKGTPGMEIPAQASRRTLFDATVVNFLNPGPYLGWSLVIGPLFLEGWKVLPGYGVLLLTGFYLTMFLVSAGIILLFDVARERVPKLQRTLLGISAIALALFGIYQLLSGILSL